VWIRNGKLCGNFLKIYQVQNKPNLNNIFKSYLSYHDLEGLRNSSNYFQRLRKKLFAIIRLSLLTFFFTFTSIKRLWDLLIKSLHTLHVSKLNLSTKIKDFRSVHIIELIWVDPITCARYYNHKTSCFHKLITKDDYLFGYICRYLI